MDDMPCRLRPSNSILYIASCHLSSRWASYCSPSEFETGSMRQATRQQPAQGSREAVTTARLNIPLLATPRGMQSSKKRGTRNSWICLTAIFWTDWWSIEILTIFFTTACFVSLVIVLAIYDSKTVPQLPFDITFNAIISILATAIKSSLLLVLAAALGQCRWLWLRRSVPDDCNLYDIQLLDDASRGPWGSLILLRHLRGRWLVSIGAIAVILSIALEPFVQQIPSYYPTTQRLASHDVTIPRALTWNEQGTYTAWPFESISLNLHRV